MRGKPNELLNELLKMKHPIQDILTDVNILSNSAEFVKTIKKKKYLIFLLPFILNYKNYSIQGNSQVIHKVIHILTGLY